MELLQIENYFVAYQRAGNDKNGNPIWLVNIFREYEQLSVKKISLPNVWQNENYLTNKKLDKNGNIRMQSYNIGADVKNMVERLN